jgi:hypothetical protein
MVDEGEGGQSEDMADHTLRHHIFQLTGCRLHCLNSLHLEAPLTTLGTGAWLIHPILIFCLKILYDIIPGISQETSWTLTNLTYVAGSYLMFHWVRGIPFDFNAGAYDNLNMWEQIDNGDQYTPAKKYLMSVPIILFLVSTHYTHYDLRTFTLNLVATILVTIPKLPAVSLISNIRLPRVLTGNSLTGYEQHSSPDRQRTGLASDGNSHLASAFDVFALAFFWE